MALNIVQQIDNRIKINNVIISVSDKTDLPNLVNKLLQINPDLKIFSTGGTYKFISEAIGEMCRKNLISVSDYTGQPEMQGGLVKTLDFKIYLGLLSETYNEHHIKDMERIGAVAFDMVVVNLYPFVKTVARPGVKVEEARTNIDIGGPCMIRAAAKNFIRIAAVTDPADYQLVLEELEKNAGTIGLKMRFILAQKAFGHTAAYDRAISEYLGSRNINDVSSCYTIL